MKTKIIAILLMVSSFVSASDNVTIEIQKAISASISVSISQKGSLNIAFVGGNAPITYDPLGRTSSIGEVRIAYDPQGRTSSVVGNLPKGYGIQIRLPESK